MISFAVGHQSLMSLSNLGRMVHWYLVVGRSTPKVRHILNQRVPIALAVIRGVFVLLVELRRGMESRGNHRCLDVIFMDHRCINQN